MIKVLYCHSLSVDVNLLLVLYIYYLIKVDIQSYVIKPRIRFSHTTLPSIRAVRSLPLSHWRSLAILIIYCVAVEIWTYRSSFLNIMSWCFRFSHWIRLCSERRRGNFSFTNNHMCVVLSRRFTNFRIYPWRLKLRCFVFYCLLFFGSCFVKRLPCLLSFLRNFSLQSTVSLTTNFAWD